MISFFRRLFLKDLPLKVFSLAMALMVYFIVKHVTAPGASFRSTLPRQQVFAGLPVVVMSSAENVMRFRISPKEVKVTVQGDRRLLDELKPTDIRVVVDLTGIESANDLHKHVEVTVPAGLSAVKVEPPEVEAVFPP
jgi:hypothetical protein